LIFQISKSMSVPKRKQGKQSSGNRKITKNALYQWLMKQHNYWQIYMLKRKKVTHIFLFPQNDLREFENVKKLGSGLHGQSRSDVTECTLHDLRRSVITNWASHLPIQVVQQLAGHSDISTTRKYYLTVRPEDMVSANKVVNSIFAKSPAN